MNLVNMMTMKTTESRRSVALEFLVSETASYSRVPRRIRKRFLAECKTPPTVEEIEAKLRQQEPDEEDNRWESWMRTMMKMEMPGTNMLSALIFEVVFFRFNKWIDLFS